MAIEDIVVVEGEGCVYRPIMAWAGEILTCPNGHPVADIIETIRLGDALMPRLFAHWRGREGWTPRAADIAAGIEGDPLPLCPVCGANPWLGPQNDLRLWTERGYRCLPGDPPETCLG